MPDSNSKLPDAAVDSHAAAPLNAARRRLLLKGGAGAAPVLMSLVSQPVSATGLAACAKASSFVSVRTYASRNPNTTSARCSSGGATTCRTFWVAEANRSPLNSTYATNLNKTVANFLVASNCWRSTTLVKDVLKQAESSHAANPILQRILALALSLSHGRVSNPGQVSVTYLGQVWLNRSQNGVYKYYGDAYTMTDQQLIDWLDAISGTRVISVNG